MIALNILLGVAAAVLLLGVLGEKDNQRHKSITLRALCGSLLAECRTALIGRSGCGSSGSASRSFYMCLFSWRAWLLSKARKELEAEKEEKGK